MNITLLQTIRDKLASLKGKSVKDLALVAVTVRVPLWVALLAAVVAAAL